MGHAIKLKFSAKCSSSISSAIRKLNISISSCLSDSVQCRRGLHFELYISTLEHARMIILICNVPQASINTIYIYCHAWVI